jgi:hypothetical protein
LNAQPFQVLRRRIIKLIQDAGLYGVSMDETADTRVRSISRLQCCGSYDVKSLANDLFLGICQCMMVVLSDTIHSALISFLHEQGLAIEYFVSVCTDGDSAMSGIHSGVVSEEHAWIAFILVWP